MVHGAAKSQTRLSNFTFTFTHNHIPGSGRSLGEGPGNPLQYSCLENPMDRGAWQATVHGVTKESDTTEVTLHTHTYIHIITIYWYQHFTTRNFPCIFPYLPHFFFFFFFKEMKSFSFYYYYFFNFWLHHKKDLSSLSRN